MYNLNQFNALSAVLGNFALAGLSGAATTHSHTASLVNVVNGVVGTSPSGTTTPTTNSSATAPGTLNFPQAAGAALAGTAPTTGFRAALVVWTVNSAGTKKIRSNGFYTGAEGATLDLDFPTIPSDENVVAFHTVKLATTVSGTWTYGSSNWNATGVTIGAVSNCVGMPNDSVLSVSY